MMDMIAKIIFSFSGNFPAISDDLVNSYHLLLSCLDLFYTNAMTTRHTKEMVNPEFTEGKSCQKGFYLVSFISRHL